MEQALHPILLRLTELSQRPQTRVKFKPNGDVPELPRQDSLVSSVAIADGGVRSPERPQTDRSHMLFGGRALFADGQRSSVPYISLGGFMVESSMSLLDTVNLRQVM